MERKEKSRESNITRLQEELFNGKEIQWQPSQRLGPEFRFVEDERAWYTNRKGTDVIYVQPKVPENAMATCYGCGSDILGRSQQVTEWAESGPGPCAGVETRMQTTLYCPRCEPVPSRTPVRIITE